MIFLENLQKFIKKILLFVVEYFIINYSLKKKSKDINLFKLFNIVLNISKNKEKNMVQYLVIIFLKNFMIILIKERMKLIIFKNTHKKKSQI